MGKQKRAGWSTKVVQEAVEGETNAKLISYGLGKIQIEDEGMFLASCGLVAGCHTARARNRLDTSGFSELWLS